MSSLPFSQAIDLLKQPLFVSGHEISNRLVIQPMEGCDGTSDGAPDELTVRRYHRFSQSGAGLIWFEAVAVQRDGRANPRQLWLTKDNLDSYKKLIADIKETAGKTTGTVPVIIMQATHSGRYSKPEGKPAPLCACNNPIFEGEHPLPPERIITDDAIRRIEESYGETAKLAMAAGFDGLDVKCCHRYLNNELLSAFTRPGEYGGSFENRTRFFMNAMAQVRAHGAADFIVTSRMNIYDGFPYPYGFGAQKTECTPPMRFGDDFVWDEAAKKTYCEVAPNLDEPIRLIQRLQVELLNITIGNPYFNPQVNRPVKLSAVERMYQLTKQIQDRFPALSVLSSAPTFMKEKAGELAAGAVEQGYCKLVGFGRMAFAYPNFARDLLSGCFDEKQMCITCGKCTELMRAGSVTGCVIRDKVYTELYRQVCRAVPL